jgi:hypothetical protein
MHHQVKCENSTDSCPRRNIRSLNCGVPFLSSEQISPSITALASGSQWRLSFLILQKKRTDGRSEKLTACAHARLWQHPQAVPFEK